MNRVLMGLLVWLGRSETTSSFDENPSERDPFATSEYDDTYTHSLFPRDQHTIYSAQGWQPSQGALNIFSRQSKRITGGIRNQRAPQGSRIATSFERQSSEEDEMFAKSSESSEPFVRTYRFRGEEDALADLVREIQETMRQIKLMGEDRGADRVGPQPPVDYGRSFWPDNREGGFEGNGYPEQVDRQGPIGVRQIGSEGYNVPPSNGRDKLPPPHNEVNRPRVISGDHWAATGQGLSQNYYTPQSQPEGTTNTGEHLEGPTRQSSVDRVGGDVQPSHLIVPANTVNEIYRTIVDENPNNWIEHQYPLDIMPTRVEIPLTLVKSNYIGVMTIGTAKPGTHDQKVRVLFDTGSRVFWVLTREACNNNPCNADNRAFDRDKSMSYKKNGNPIESKFVGKSQVFGRKGKDDITIGEGQSKLVIRGQEFGEATAFNEMFQYYDVLMGLDIVAPPFMNGKTVSPLYQMTKQYGTAPVFGFYINRYDKNKSKMIFGGGDEDLIVGQFNNHPVRKVIIHGIGRWYSGWNVKVDTLLVTGVDSAPVVVPVGEEFFAHPDTGATLISGPEDLMQKLNDEIFKFRRFRVNDDFSFSCTEDTSAMMKYFPKVSIYIDGHEYVMEPRDYIGRLGGKCTTLLRGHTMFKYLLLGRMFMQKYYTRFDHGNKMVQFGLAREDIVPKPPTTGQA